MAQRAPLIRRDQRLSLETKIGKTSVVSATGSRTGGYFCEVCQCALKDSGAYLDHINGRKRMSSVRQGAVRSREELGMTLRGVRCVRVSRPTGAGHVDAYATCIVAAGARSLRDIEAQARGDEFTIRYNAAASLRECRYAEQDARSRVAGVRECV